MTKISFAPGAWENAGLVYAYSWRFPELPVFRQEDTCIVNSPAPDTRQLYDYMGLLLPETYGTGAKLSVRCSFEDYGAPMLVISPKNEIDENGILRTLDYYELVIWKKGLNVWQLHTEDRKVSYNQLLGVSFPVTEQEVHTLSVELQEKRLLIQLDDRKFNLYLQDLPESCRLGYTACEGFCRLYEMTVE